MEQKDLSPEQVVRQLFEGQLNARNKELSEKIWAKDAKYHGAGMSVTGSDQIEKLIEERRKIIPNLYYILDDIFSFGEKVAVRWHGEGDGLKDETCSCSLCGCCGYWGISIMIVRNGQIVENWESTNSEPTKECTCVCRLSHKSI